MGSTPKLEEIPVDLSDLFPDTQLAIQIYRMLPDLWAGMTGHYLGKELSSLKIMFDIWHIEDSNLQSYILYTIKILDVEMSEIISAKIKNQTDAATNKPSIKRGKK